MTIYKGRDVFIMVNGKPLTGVQRGSGVTLPYEDMEQIVGALMAGEDISLNREYVKNCNKNAQKLKELTGMVEVKLRDHPCFAEAMHDLLLPPLEPKDLRENHRQAMIKRSQGKRRLK